MIAGIPVSNVSFVVFPLALMSSQSLLFNVSWLTGTEVNFTINILSNTSLQFQPVYYNWMWNVENYTTSYGAMSAHFTNLFLTCGIYSTTLTILNSISLRKYSAVVVVNPILNETITFSNFYSCAPAPNNVSIMINPSSSWKCVTDVICSFNFGDNTTLNVSFIMLNKTLIFYHKYVLDKPEVYASVICSNNYSTADYNEMFILQQNITGLKIITFGFAFSSNSTIYFNISMDTGSDVNFYVDFDDGTSNTCAHFNRLSYEEPYQFSHVYSAPGNYSVQVTAYNKYFSSNVSLFPPIIIQNPLVNYSFVFPHVLTLPPFSQVLSIIPSMSIEPASDVTCKWSLGNISASSACHFLENNLQEDLVITYNENSVNLGIDFTVLCSNLVSEQVFSQSVDIFIVIQDLNILLYRENVLVIDEVINATNSSYLLAVLPTDNVTVVAKVASGSSIYYRVTFLSSMFFSNLAPLTVRDSFEAFYSYETISNYTVNVTTWNVVSSIEFSVAIVVQNAVTDLTLHHNKSVLCPPGIVDFSLVSAATILSPLTDVSCVWNFSTGFHSVEFIPLLDILHPYNLTYKFNYLDEGIVNVSLNCSNMLSYQSINTSILVVADAVFLSSLFCNTTVVRNTTHITVTVARYASISCFVINFDDGLFAAFATDVDQCSDMAIPHADSYEHINSSMLSWYLTHTYKLPGVYMVKLLAFSTVNNDTKTFPAIVDSLPCQNPILILPANLNFLVFTSFRSVAFVVNPNITLNCTIPWPYATQWQVFDMSAPTSGSLLTINNDTFSYSANSLNYGIYNVSVLVAMSSTYGINMDGISSASWFILQIVKTPLKAFISGGEFVSIRYDELYVLNALNMSYDPDVSASNKIGLKFHWFCKQYNEPLNCTSTTVTSSRTSVDHVYDLVNEKGGCFGDGAAQLVESDGQITLSTKNMLPRLNYTFCVQVFKDDRVAAFEQTMELLAADPPIINIRWEIGYGCISIFICLWLLRCALIYCAFKYSSYIHIYCALKYSSCIHIYCALKYCSYIHIYCALKYSSYILIYCVLKYSSYVLIYCVLKCSSYILCYVQKKHKF